MSGVPEPRDPLVARLDAAEANAAEQINGIDLEQPVDLAQVLGAGRDPGPEPSYVREEIDAKQDRTIKAAAGAGATQRAPRGYSFSDACHSPLSSPYTLKGVAAPGCITVTFGDAGTLKSFLATDVAAHVGLGRDWHGRRVNGCGVLVVLGAGQGGYARRLRAWASAKGIDPKTVKLYVCPSAVDLNSGPAELADAIAEAQAALGCTVGLVLVDTYSTNLGDADEQSNSDAARVFHNARLAAGPDCGIFFVHHVGHTDKSRERGAYQIRGIADFSFQLKREDKIITLTNVKAKDGGEIAPMTFTFHQVELGTDEDGDTVTSLVVSPIQSSPTPAKRPRPKGANQVLALQAIEAAINLHGRHPQGVDFRKDAKGVTVDQARAEFDCAAGHIASNKRSTRFSEAVSSLKASGHVAGVNDWLWLSG